MSAFGGKATCLIRARMSGNDMQRIMSWLLHLRHRHDLDDFYPCAGHSQKWMVFANSFVASSCNSACKTE